MCSSLDAQGEGWRFADKGDHFPGTVNGALISELPPAIIPSEVFYVAFWWDYNFLTLSGNELFGWAKLQVAPPLPPSPSNPFDLINPDLILLASATTTDDRGIVVGEYRVIPEPASMAYAAIALVGLAILRKRSTGGRWPALRGLRRSRTPQT